MFLVVQIYSSNSCSVSQPQSNLTQLHTHTQEQIWSAHLICKHRPSLIFKLRKNTQKWNCMDSGKLIYELLNERLYLIVFFNLSSY